MCYMLVCSVGLNVYITAPPYWLSRSTLLLVVVCRCCGGSPADHMFYVDSWVVLGEDIIFSFHRDETCSWAAWVDFDAVKRHENPLWNIILTT